MKKYKGPKIYFCNLKDEFFAPNFPVQLMSPSMHIVPAAVIKTFGTNETFLHFLKNNSLDPIEKTS